MKWRLIRARRVISKQIMDEWRDDKIDTVEAGTRLIALEKALGIERPKPGEKL
jgi:hypothetical protein